MFKTIDFVSLLDDSSLPLLGVRRSISISERLIFCDIDCKCCLRILDLHLHHVFACGLF